MNSRITTALRVIVYVGALIPLALLIWHYTRNELTANPVRQIQLLTGRYAINILMLSLACTPVYILSGFKSVLVLRRPLGIYAFLYVCLHFLNFIWLDYGFNFTFLSQDIFQKPYAFVGLVAFILLIPLAITSTKGWVKRLGFRNWQWLHRLIYIIAILVVIHYIWQTKAQATTPYILGVVLIVLIIIRLPPMRNFLQSQLPWLKNKS